MSFVPEGAIAHWTAPFCATRPRLVSLSVTELRFPEMIQMSPSCVTFTGGAPQASRGKEGSAVWPVKLHVATNAEIATTRVIMAQTVHDHGGPVRRKKRWPAFTGGHTTKTH